MTLFLENTWIQFRHGTAHFRYSKTGSKAKVVSFIDLVTSHSVYLT